MSIEDQIEEAERMQQWGRVDQLRAQRDAVWAEPLAAPVPENAAPEGGDVDPAPAADPVSPEAGGP